MVHFKHQNYHCALQQNLVAPSQRPAEAPKNQLNNQTWSGVLSITLVEGRDLPQYGHGDIYVRYRLGDQKYKSKVGLKNFSYTLSSCSSVFYCLFFILQVFLLCPYLLLPSFFLSAGACQQQVTHLHLGSLGHGRGSSLDWARLPLTSPLASAAGLHCLHLHTQHALFIYLYLLASPLMIPWCTCLVLSCHFFVNLSAFLSACLFVEQS